LSDLETEAARAARNAGRPAITVKVDALITRKKRFTFAYGSGAEPLHAVRLFSDMLYWLEENEITELLIETPRRQYRVQLERLSGNRRFGEWPK